jgi:hypothetical protein
MPSKVIFLCSQARKDSGLNFIVSRLFSLKFEKAASVPELEQIENARDEKNRVRQAHPQL